MTAREQVIGIAQRVADEDITAAAAVLKLARLSALPETGRAELLAELVDEIDHANTIALGDYDTGLCGPGEDDLFLSEDAERRVNDAADAFLATPATQKTSTEAEAA